jgi:lysophospholipase L1-like esterase
VRLLFVITAIAALCSLKTHNPNPSYLALGDSYTIGESVDSNDRYPVQALHQIDPGGRPDIIATTGWTTANLLDALDAAKPAAGYQAVSLLIGVNNQYQGRSQAEYREQFITLLKTSIQLAGDRPSHVLVLSIPDYSVTPFARNRNFSPQYIAAQIDSFNAINNRIAAAYSVNYLDVTAESRKAATDPSLIAADGLHFSGKEYAIWARLMEPYLKEMLR